MPSPGTIFRLRTRGTLHGQRVEFGLHFNNSTGAGVPANLAAAWVANTMPLVVAATSTAVNWDDVIVTDVSPDGVVQVVTGLTQPMPGTVTGDCLPGQNAILVRLHTPTKGGRRRGRFYLPGVSESNSANGLVSGSQLTAVQALATGIITQYGPTGTTPIWRVSVFSPVDTTPPPPRPFKPKETELVTAITTADVDPIIRTQRRRNIGVGI